MLLWFSKLPNLGVNLLYTKRIKNDLAPTYDNVSHKFVEVDVRN